MRNASAACLTTVLGSIFRRADGDGFAQSLPHSGRGFFSPERGAGPSLFGRLFSPRRFSGCSNYRSLICRFASKILTMQDYRSLHRRDSRSAFYPFRLLKAPL